MSKVGLFVIGWLRWLLDSSSMSLSLRALSRCLLARSLALVPVRAVSRLFHSRQLYSTQRASPGVVCQRPASRALELATKYTFDN